MYKTYNFYKKTPIKSNTHINHVYESGNKMVDMIVLRPKPR